MSWLVPLPVVLPLLVAAGLVAAAPICRRRVADLTAIATAAVAMIACGFLVHFSAQSTIVCWFGGWLPRGSAAGGIAFTIDPFGAGTAVFSSCLMVAALVYAWEYFEAVRTYFHALMMIFLAAMNGFCLTGDLFNLFVFFELMSVVAYALTAYKVEETQALAGAVNFAVTNSVGAFLVLLGIGLVYGRTGALNLAQVGEALARHPAVPLTLVALTLLACGFFVKAAVVPFHFWLADAHAVAPTPVCVLFSGVMIELGLYGSFRVYWTVFHPSLGAAEGNLKIVLMSFGALTAALGAVMCVSQRHLKRLLAFSSISHLGMMLTGAACLDSKGFAGAAMYAIGHGFVKGALFMSAGMLLNRFGSVDESELFARGKKLPVLAVTVAVSGLGLSGFPPFGTYLGKQMMEEGGANIGQHWLTWLFVFCSALTGGAVLRVVGMIFLGWGAGDGEAKRSPTKTKEEPEARNAGRRLPFVMLAITLLMALVPLVSAFVGDRLATGIHAASTRFADQRGYLEAVIDGAMPPPLHAQGHIHSTGKGLLFGFVAAGGSVLVALHGLFGDRLPQKWIKPFNATARAFIDPLRRVHSGHIGDLIVWLVIGVVTIGAALRMAIGIR